MPFYISSLKIILPLHCSSQDGDAALILAADRGHFNVVQALLEVDATIDIQNNVSVKGLRDVCEGGLGLKGPFS